MTFISIKDAQTQLADLARRVREGETIVVTQDGEPVADLVPHKGEAKRAGNKAGIDFEAGQAYLRSIGVTNPVPYTADDFDDPLPEDFLLQPLPEPKK